MQAFGTSLRSPKICWMAGRAVLVPLDFLERRRGRDQIDLSVTVSPKNPVEGRGLRGIKAAQQSEDPTPAGHA